MHHACCAKQITSSDPFIFKHLWPTIAGSGVIPQMEIHNLQPPLMIGGLCGEPVGMQIVCSRDLAQPCHILFFGPVPVDFKIPLHQSSV